MNAEQGMMEDGKRVSASGFYIVNFFDRPYERHIAQERDGKLYYVHSDLRNAKAFMAMPMEDATPLEDYGIVISVGDAEIIARHSGVSVVTYKDGSIRRWQGSHVFIIELDARAKLTFVAQLAKEARTV